MPESRNKIFDSIFSLKDIKPSEQGRINPAYCNISAVGRFDPIETVMYIWALTENNEIIIGIDKPWEYPQAFNIDIHIPEQQALWDVIAAQFKEGLFSDSPPMSDSSDGSSPNDSLSKATIGHPTIVVHFETDENKVGTVIPGRCVLGGDLYYNENEWILNNRSGRFGRKNETGVKNQQKVEHMLRYAAQQFTALGLHVTPRLYFHQVDPELESSILGGSTKALDEVEQAIRPLKRNP